MVRTFLKTLVVLLGYLVAADIVGVIVCVLFDIAPLRYESGALPYAIWFVLGVFTGFIVYGTAGAWASPDGDEDWMTRPGALGTGNVVLVSSLVVLLALGGFFHWLYWSRGVAGEYFVPDSASHTITFFVAVIGAMWVARTTLAPKPAAGPR